VPIEAKVQHLLSATGRSASCRRGTAAAYRGFVALVVSSIMAAAQSFTAGNGHELDLMD
jgi:hypothetical protein